MSIIPNPLDIGEDVVKGAATTILDLIADAIGKFVETCTAGIGTAWIRIDTPNLATADGHATPVVAFLRADVLWLVLALAVLSIMVGAIHAMWTRTATPLRDLARGLVELAIVSSAGVAVIGLAVTFSDQFAQWIVDGALQDGDFGKSLAGMLALTGIGAPMGVIVLGFISLVTALIQMALLVFRGAVLVVMTGTLAVPYSFAGTETGRTWANRYVTWLLALIVYKPAAALIYATSFRLVAEFSASDNGLLAAVTGVMFMGVAVLTLPALLRLLAPAAGAIHLRSGGGGAASMAMVAATGARAVHAPLSLAAMGATNLPTGAVNTPAPPPPAPPVVPPATP